MQTLDTINVLEIVDDSIVQLVAFPNTPGGNAAARELFLKLLVENIDEDDPPSDADLQAYTQNGWYWQDSDGSDYEVRLLSSTVVAAQETPTNG